MNLPLPRRSPERSRGSRAGWPGDRLDPVGELWNRMGQLLGPFGGQGTWVPTVETEEDGEAYLVRAELPGMRREDIEVELASGELRITGETTEEAGGQALRRRHGQFAYRTSLPADADIERAEARLAHGVLTVRLPKTGQSRSRKIEVMSDTGTI
jgi:HSP20 family protein